MTQFEKDYQSVVQEFKKVVTPDQLNAASRLKRFFFDKYVVLISQTDKKFIQVQSELNELEILTTKKISSAYFFNKN